MFKTEEGFSTPVALIVIFSLCLLVISVVMLVYTNEKKIDSYKRQIVAEKKAEKLLQDIGKEIQSLKEDENDSPDAIAKEKLLAKYKEENVTVSDVSTGINQEFLKDEILESESVIQYLAADDAQLSDYGWINPKYAEQSIVNQVETDFGESAPFPIINDFPLYNIFEMTTDFLTTILSFNNITEPEDKAEKIKNLLPENINIEKLCEILGVQKNHPVFDFLGTKTIFWKVTFETEEYKTSAVFAAVPQKDDKKKIDKYVLVEHKFSYKGGKL